MRVLALVSDAFGGRGGIAKFNRDMLHALCAHPQVREVVAVPRVMPEAAGALPGGLTYRTEAAGGKLAFARTVLGCAVARGGYDVVVCGHINLLPAAAAAARRSGVPLVLIVHGIDAWQPPGRALTDYLAGRADAVVAVSDFTRRRFAAWTGLPAERAHVVPNCVDAAAFGPGPKSDALLDRYGLRGRTVLLTVARLSGAERYKGHDQMLAALPELAHAYPDLAYLIVGTGDDLPRLRARARWLGISDRVVFAGHVAEHEKADHYRLADAFVMPGRKEGFGIVYLEALACGIPVVASVADASREAVLDGEIGFLADPDDQADIVRSTTAALQCTRREVPPQLERFSQARFEQRWHGVLNAVVGRAPTAVGHLSSAHP